MKFYTLETEFTFGKYKGQTVRQLIDLHSIYLDWCAINLDHFFISEDVIGEIRKINPNFSLTDEGIQKLEDKYSTWEGKQNIRNNDNRNNHTDLTDNYWDSYNDDLDMDQQGPDFWNQF